MSPKHHDLERMISVDVETAGPNPAEYALLAIGACTLSEPRRHFCVLLQPDKPEQDAEAMNIHGLKFEDLQQDGTPPREALLQFEQWLKENVPAGQIPLFVGFNAPFDWMFICDYFHHYLGHNPFGHNALDIKSYYLGLHLIPWNETSIAKLANKSLRHEAMTDACDQADILLALLDEQNARKDKQGGCNG